MKKTKKYQDSSSSETESSGFSKESRFFDTSTRNRKKYKKDTEKSKSGIQSTSNESTTFAKSLSYNDLTFNKTTQQPNKNDDLYDSLQEEDSRELSQKIKKQNSNKKKKEIKSVKFVVKMKTKIMKKTSF